MFLILPLHSSSTTTYNLIVVSKIRVYKFRIIVVVVDSMGCKESKFKDNYRHQELVMLCRERKRLLKAAADHRFALAAAHAAYFGQLAVVGDTLWRFVEEELVLLSSSSSSSSSSLSSSSISSPEFTVFSDEVKSSSKSEKNFGAKNMNKNKNQELPQHGISYIPDHSASYGFTNFPWQFPYYGDNNVNQSNLGFNNYSDYPAYNGGAYFSSFNNNNNGNNDSSYGFDSTATTYTGYYMKKSSSKIPIFVYEEPKHVNNPIYSFSDAQSYDYQNAANDRKDQQQQQKTRVPIPPSPKVSAWDYFNPFDSDGFGGAGEMYGFGNGYESSSSSQDSREVREREGIPDLEEETETEFSFPSSNTKRAAPPNMGSQNVPFRDHVRDAPFNSNGSKKKNKKNTNNVRNSSSRSNNGRAPFVEPELKSVDEEGEVEGRWFSPETEPSVVTLSTSREEEDESGDKQERVHVKKKGVSFEAEEDELGQSSMRSSLTTLSAHGTRDLREVVKEIKDEFEAATYYGNEVSSLLEVGREPYRSRSTFVEVMSAKVCPTSLTSYHSLSDPGAGYLEAELKSPSLASTLDKLYVWEKKLYKAVKDEEMLRLTYEKQCKKLKTLDEQGAESSKVEATQLSIRDLLIQINISVRTVNSISRRIHKLRDEELQPRLKELLYGLRKMWNLMLKCHKKQFQGILETKTRSLRANTGLRRDSSERATIQLEAELLKWHQHFNNWIEMQRSYAQTLNGWLERCIQYEPEVTSDGVMPFSPGRYGAPPVFVMCHDWKQAMERISESEVQSAMNSFATSLRQLWEKQDEEQRQRLKTEDFYTDFEKQIRFFRAEKGQKGYEHDDALSDKNSLSIIASDIGILPADVKVNLDSLRQRVREERAGHKEAVKLVHDAVSQSIQAGLIPIFESLESFTSEASKALDDVRLEHVSNRI
ncbi:hypothetical protein RND81_14G003600 [Saponaria officinalis]|uniref:Uncharacterized protein n=1 Tax=Saponaria officinalis TaxID=3572 RepID=A0AAW1GJC1_SAPOF